MRPLPQTNPQKLKYKKKVKYAKEKGGSEEQTKEVIVVCEHVK